MHNQIWQLHRIQKLKTIKRFSSQCSCIPKSSCKCDTKDKPKIEESEELKVLSLEELNDLVLEQPGKDILDPPAILIMRRKSIRQFPNNQRVALYFVDKINKYVSVPYTAMQWSTSPSIPSVAEEIEEDVISQLKTIVETETSRIIKFKDGKSMRVNEDVASLVLKTYKELNHENRENVSAMVNESKEQFNKIIDFARKHSK